MLAISMDLLLRILIYVSVGILPIVYNYYFVRSKVESLRKTYISKFKKYAPILPLLDSEVHGISSGKSKSVGKPRLTSIGSSNITFESSKLNNLSDNLDSNITYELKGRNVVEPYVITSHIVTSVPEAGGDNGSYEAPYVVLIIDPQTLRSPETLKAILSSVENVIPTHRVMVNEAYKR